MTHADYMASTERRLTSSSSVNTCLRLAIVSTWSGSPESSVALDPSCFWLFSAVRGLLRPELGSTACDLDDLTQPDHLKTGLPFVWKCNASDNDVIPTGVGD